MNIRESVLEKRSGKTKIIIALMFLALMSPKAWSYAEKELSPSFSENTFSSGDTLSSDDTFSLSRAVLTDEKGVAICQVNLVENPQFLPEFAEADSSEGLEPLDLPECEEQSLDIVAQYAEQAWVKKDVALAPAVLATGGITFVGGCWLGLSWLTSENGNTLLPIATGAIGLGALYTTIKGSGGWNFAKRVMMKGTGIAALGGLLCYSLGYQILYQ